MKGIPDKTVSLAAEMLAETPLSVVLGEVPPIPGVDADAELATLLSVLVGPALAGQEAEVGRVTPALCTDYHPLIGSVVGVLLVEVGVVKCCLWRHSRFAKIVGKFDGR